MDAKDLQKLMEVIFSRCRRLLGQHDLAWDAVQEVFTRFYEVAPQQAIKDPLRFLYRSSTNYCIDLMRTKDRLLPLEHTLVEECWGSTSQQAEDALLIRKLLRRFGQEAVEMMTYRYVDQMTYKEIGHIYNKSDRGIKKKIERLESQMRKYLKR